MPWLVSSAGLGAVVETAAPGLEFDLPGAAHASRSSAPPGPLRLHVLCDPTPGGAAFAGTAAHRDAALLPEWAYGHWKSRDVYEHQRDVMEDLDGYREHDIPLDAIVIDSPWETQYNTWEFNPISSRTRRG